MSKMRPVGYWREWVHVEQVLKPLIEKKKGFPTRVYLKEQEGGGVLVGIDRYHGGIRAVAERFGYKAGKEKDGHWLKKENVLALLQEVMQEHQLTRIPSSVQLNAWGYSSVSAAIMNHHGGFQKLRAERGEEQLRTIYGTRGDIKKGIAEAQACMREHGLKTLPRCTVLVQLGYGSLAAGIGSHYGGMRAFRKRLGQEQRITASGTWKSLEFTLQEAEKIKRKHKVEELPSKNELDRMGYSSFSQAVTHYHGGFTAFRVQLGEKTARAEAERLKDEHYALQKVKGLMQTQGWEKLPTDKQLCEAGYSQIAHAIEKYQGGFSTFRKKLGEKVKKRAKNGSLRDKEVIKAKLAAFMKRKKLTTLPSAYQLQRAGEGSIVAAIHMHHGGFRKFRSELGEQPTRYPNGSWQDLTFTLERAQEFLKAHPEYETIPSTVQLQRYPKGAMLGSAISEYHGGFIAFREKLAEYLSTQGTEHKTESLLEAWVNEM